MIVNIALLTVTDTRTFENDKSGAILVKKIEEAKHKLIDRKICKDNKEDIIKILKDWINQTEIDVVITTGGTGLTGRDITPEAVNEIADKHIPGFGEVFRIISLLIYIIGVKFLKYMTKLEDLHESLFKAALSHFVFYCPCCSWTRGT